VKTVDCAALPTVSVARCWSSRFPDSRSPSISMCYLNTLTILAPDRAHWLSTAGTNAIPIPASF
jgi:hypothetical protein